MKNVSILGSILGGGYIRRCIYLDILNKISAKGVNIKSTPVIINSMSQSFIVNKKYEKICNILLKKYEKNLNGFPLSYKAKYIAAICIIVTTALASKENVEKSYAEEMILEKIEIPYNIENEYEKNDLEIQKEIDDLIASYTIPEDEDDENLIYESYLREYSKYFHFDAKKVIELAKTYTNHYTNFENVIPEEYEITSPESACLFFVYLLNRGDLDIDYNKEELVTTEKITTAPHNNLNSFYLSTGEKYSTFVGKICDFFKIEDKSIALSASYTEISMYGSYSSNTRNNFGGMKYNGEHLAYPTPEAGIICFCGNFKRHYNEYNMDSLEKLACYHVAGRKEMPDPEKEKELYEEIIRWEKSVSSFYYEICENYEYYFLPIEEVEIAKLSLKNKE